MLWRENGLGWRIHKHVNGFVIRRAHPPFRSRIWQFTPMVVSVLFVMSLWFGPDQVIRCALYAAPVFLVALWLVRSHKVRRYALLAGPAYLMFLGVLANNTMSAERALYLVPISLLLGLWFLRPAVLFVNTRSRRVIDAGFFPRVPFAQLTVEIKQDETSGLYGVHLNTETWKCLAWESGSEEEASRIAEEFRTWGMGERGHPYRVPGEDGVS
jgi:hypothetical protein